MDKTTGYSASRDASPGDSSLHRCANRGPARLVAKGRATRADADWWHGSPGNGPWIGNGAYSSWIAANPFDAHGNGLMTFTDTFDVATPSTATILGGAWTIDD